MQHDEQFKMQRQQEMMQPLESPHPGTTKPPHMGNAKPMGLSLNMDLINSGPQQDTKINETPQCQPNMISPMSNL